MRVAPWGAGFQRQHASRRRAQLAFGQQDAASERVALGRHETLRGGGRDIGLNRIRESADQRHAGRSATKEPFHELCDLGACLGHQLTRRWIAGGSEARNHRRKGCVVCGCGVVQPGCDRGGVVRESLQDRCGKGAGVGPPVQRAKCMPQRVEAKVRAAALVRHRKAVAADADCAAPEGDADASRTGDDDAAVHAAEGAQIGEVSIAFKPRAGKGMAPRLQRFAGARLACAGKTDAGINASELLYRKPGLFERLLGGCQNGLSRYFQAEAHAGRASKATSKNASIIRLETGAAARAAAIDAEEQGCCHDGSAWIDLLFNRRSCDLQGTNMSTEDVGRYPDLDLWATARGLDALFEDQREAVSAVRSALPSLAAAIDSAAPRLGRGGRLIYVGAGTSARIGVQDGAELFPTFNWPREQVAFVIAGGEGALLRAVENAEDSGSDGAARMAELDVGANDVVIGLAASGNTPFTVAAIEAARRNGALTIGIANNRGSRLLAACEHPILIDTGAEAIAGSTRLKAGTAQKVVLNLFSTMVMVRLGKVYRGMMVHMRPNNEKLRKRAVRMVATISGCSEDAAANALSKSTFDVKLAVLLLSGMDRSAAENLLAKHQGNLRLAMAELPASA